MNLFVAWRDSLTLLQPKNFKLFMLVTLKSMVDTFKVWIKYFWWLIALAGIKVGAMVLIQAAMARQETTGMLIDVLSLFNAIPLPVYLIIPSLFFIARATLLLAARPSTAIKKCAYFRSYFWRSLIAIAVLQGLDYLGTMGWLLVRSAYPACTELIVCGHNISLMGLSFVMYLLAIYAINYSLFLFDGDGSVKSFFKSWGYAIKMTIFNVPFYSIIILLNIFGGLGITYLIIYSIGFVGGQEGIVFVAPLLLMLFAFIQLLTICFLTNFYVKKLHDQFTLYFGKND